MAFPYILSEGFETGVISTDEFDTALTDTQSKSLGYLHYTDTLRRFNLIPFRGAYCWGIDQSVGTVTTDIYQTEAAFNVSNTNTYAVGCAIYLKGNTMATDNRTSLVTVRSASADEAVVQLYYTTAGGFQLLCTKAFNTAPTNMPVTAITENKWHWIEIRGTVQTGGTGTIDFFVDGAQVGAQITGLTNAAVTDLFVGATNADAGHTAGYIFYDEIVADADAGTAAIAAGYPVPRFPRSLTLSRAGHVFVGPGTVATAAILSANTSNAMTLYDTDTANTDAPQNFVADLIIGAQTSIQGPLVFQRGCYAVVSGGTAPRGQIILDMGDTFAGSGLPHLAAYSEAGMRDYALRSRKPRPGNI